jgi:mono/diheme cytochrome c family protein
VNIKIRDGGFPDVLLKTPPMSFTVFQGAVRPLMAGLLATLGTALWAQTPTPGVFPPWVAPADALAKANPLPADPSSIAAGKELFTAACMPCHGVTGRGDGVAAPSLERDGKPIRPGNLTSPTLKQQSDGALFWKISNGNNPMPGFQESYSETQRWQIVNYVRTLAPAADATPVKKESKLSGAEIYSMHCARCHPERYPAERTSAQWRTIALHMRVRVNMPAEHARKLLQYLQENSVN